MTSQIYNYYIGIDPGAKGAVACLTEDGYCMYVNDLPTTDEDWVELLKIDYLRTHQYVLLENVHALPRQSTVAGFTFGKNVGKAELLACNMATDEVMLIAPQAWKRYFHLNKDKHKSVELARELFPEETDKLLISKDGRAEALLIAEYCRRHCKGEL